MNRNPSAYHCGDAITVDFFILMLNSLFYIIGEKKREKRGSQSVSLSAQAIQYQDKVEGKTEGL